MVESRLLVLRILCGAFVVSLGFYGLAVTALARGQAPVEVPDVLVVVLGASGALSLVLAAILGKTLRERPGADPERAFFVGTLVAFALRESCAVLGLVLAFLARQPLWYAAFAAPAAIAMLMGWPRSHDASG